MVRLADSTRGTFQLWLLSTIETNFGGGLDSNPIILKAAITVKINGY
jgi:hypothetical protein